MKQKSILAFSGGLDTSVVVKYMQDMHDMDVVTVTVDVGQGDDSNKIARKAKKLGVKKHYNIDAKKEFVTDYIFPAIKANALYQKKYCLATALARPLIIDQNLWGRAIEGGVLENPFNEPPDDAFIWIKTKNLPEKPAYLKIKFTKGVPTEVDGKKLPPVKLIEYINKKAGSHGVGIVDHIEDRVVGIKSREVYETPAALCLIEAHSDLEKMVHTKHETKFKTLVDDEWAWMVYSGLWDDPLREELDQFIEQAQKRVTGTVKLKLYKGNVRVVGRESKYSLYSHDIATYGKDSTFDQKLAKGFVELWGMQSTEANKF